MTSFKTRLATMALAFLLPATAAVKAEELGMADPQRDAYYEALKGKKVVFVPLALGFDLTDGWYAGMKNQLEPLGISVDVRDPNWSTEAGSRAISSLIAEKPDAIVVHNPDVQTYAKLLRKAEQAGIHVLQINMKSAYSTDVFAGADYVDIGRRAAEAVVAKCSAGTSGKIAIVQGPPTAAASAYQLRGISQVLEKHPEITVVSNQAADWDASKARAITETTLQQHPDLCGIIGFWDGMDVGTGAAVKQAGRDKDIFIVTSGGGGKAGCDNLKDGVFDLDISYDVPGQARDLANGITSLLQSKSAPGANNYSLYTQLQMLTPETLDKYRNFGACWTVDSLASK
ncbi:MAG: hypothetical protein RLZZ444_4376 [Pseudomonadota bacterium]